MKAMSGWIGVLVAVVMTVLMHAVAGATTKRGRRAGMIELAMLALVVGAVMVLAAPGAMAGYEAIDHTFTLDSGTSDTTEEITMNGSMIKEVILFCPTLDSGDTATLGLRAVYNDLAYTPSGWTDKAIGATDDNALVKANANLLTTPVDGTLQIIINTKTNQAAAREFKIRIIREY
jgi:hypothetical protein